VGAFVLFGIPAILAATRIARAGSWWARRYYNDEQLCSRARQVPECQQHQQRADPLADTSDLSHGPINGPTSVAAVSADEKSAAIAPQ
jgi:hypothetical protein